MKLILKRKCSAMGWYLLFPLCLFSINQLQAQNCHAYFGYSNTNNGVTVNFHDSAWASTYHWDFGDNSTSNLANPSHTYQSEGSYTVCQVVYNSDSTCIDTFCENIVVKKPCKAELQVSEISVGTYNFTSKFSLLGLDATWDFGDGSQLAKGKSAKYTYALSDTFTACLTTYNQLTGCRDTSCLDVLVKPYCKANFYAQQTTDRYVLKMDNRSQVLGNMKSVWSFGDGDSAFNNSPTHDFPTKDYYNVKLVVSDSLGTCKDSISHQVYVRGDCWASFNTYKTSNPFELELTNASGGNAPKYSWQFGDGSSSTLQTPKHVYANRGRYLVSLVVEGAKGRCKDSTSRMVTISGTCNYRLEYRPVSADSLTMRFEVTSKDTLHASARWYMNGVFRSWKYTNLVDTYRFNTSKRHLVTATVTNALGCIDSVYALIPVGTAKCIADFKVELDTSLKNAVKFINYGLGHKYYWTFGDSTNSFAQNPKHQFSKPGTYKVCLEAENKTGLCYDQYCDNVEITNSCKPSLSAIDNGAGGVRLQINNHSRSSSYRMDIGKGMTPNFRFRNYANIKFTKPDTHNICVAAFGSAPYCLDTSCLSIVVAPECKAEFSVINDKENRFRFTNLSKVLGDDFECKWDFEWTNFTHTDVRNFALNFPRNGTYTATLIVVDKTNQLSDTFSKTIVVQPTCSARIDVETFNQSHQVRTIVDYKKDIFAFEWKFNDTAKYKTDTADFTYKTRGAKTVYYSYANHDSTCWVEDSVEVVVSGLCQVDFDIVRLSNPYGIRFKMKGDDYGSARWEFGDGSHSNGSATVHHLYRSSGTYKVFLTHKNKYGCRDSISKWVVVKGCYAEFKFLNHKSDSGNLVIENTSSVQGTSNFTWDFGDGNTSNQKSPSHSYSQHGTYKICLIVNEASCVDTFCRSFKSDTLKGYNVNRPPKIRVEGGIIKGIEEESNRLEIAPHPNPFKTSFYINSLEIELVELYTLTGQLMSTELLTNPDGAMVKAPGLESGIYLLRITTPTGLVHQTRVMKL